MSEAEEACAEVKRPERPPELGYLMNGAYVSLVSLRIFSRTAGAERQKFSLVLRVCGNTHLRIFEGWRPAHIYLCWGALNRGRVCSIAVYSHARSLWLRLATRWLSLRREERGRAYSFLSDWKRSVNTLSLRLDKPNTTHTSSGTLLSVQPAHSLQASARPLDKWTRV